MRIERSPQGFAVIDTKTGLVWRTLATRAEAEAWVNAADHS